jgi:hypothetical protein
MQIVDGQIHFRSPLAEVVLHPKSIYQRNAARYGIALQSVAYVADVPIEARINHGKWIADCPDCNGAEFVFLEELFFMCAGCLNAGVGNKWRPVVVPTDRKSIEKVILARPLPQNRNWVPGETVAKLKAENVERGLPQEVAD